MSNRMLLWACSQGKIVPRRKGVRKEMTEQSGLLNLFLDLSRGKALASNQRIHNWLEKEI